MTRHVDRRARRRVVVALLALAGVAARIDDVAAQTATGEVVSIPVGGVHSYDPATAMVTAVFKPPGDGRFPVLVYSHGRSGRDEDRRHLKLLDARSHVRYWLGKGFAVVAPIRPGYGDTGGADREYSGVRYDMFGNCWGPPEFAHAASAASASLMATLEWLRQQPWADANRVVLAGSSMGGLTSIATAARNPPGVVAYINFSGGTGGDSGRAPQHSCGSAEMAALMRRYGTTTHVRGLWLYAENDLYWGPEWPRVWFSAFAGGGGPAEFVMTEPVPYSDGHLLLARGSRLWARHVDAFLAQAGF